MSDVAYESLNENIDSHFLEYNANAFAIDYLSKHIETPTFKELGPEVKRNILDKYKDMLIAKAKIDYQVLERKEAIKTNYKRLKALQSHMAADTELSKLLPSITPDYFSSEYTNGLKNQINVVNTQRLDAIWSRNFISAYLSFNNKSLPEYSHINGNFNQLNGVASYGLYIVRGGMEAAKLLKHTFSNHKFYETYKLSNWDKLKVQWGLRSKLIVNDVLLWGPVNAITFHAWQGVKGDLLTLSLFVADFFHSLYTYNQTQEYFNKLKDKLNDIDCPSFTDALEKDLELELEKQRYLMAYQLVLITCMIAIFGFINYLLKDAAKLHFMFWGSFVALAAQFFVNIIDFITELKRCEDDTQRTIIWFKLVSRVLLQTVLPALLVAFGTLLPALQLEVYSILMTSILLALYSVVVRLSNDLNVLFEVWMKPSSEQSDEHLEKTSKLLTQNSESLHLRYEWLEAYENNFKQKNAFDIAVANVKKDLWLLSALSCASIVAAELIASGFTLTVGILLITSVISLGLAAASKAPSCDVEQELQLQLDSQRHVSL